MNKRRKGIAIGLALFVVLLLGIAAISNSASNGNLQTPAQSESQQIPLSNENYYVNSSGDTVHSPAYSDNGSVPAGATARCFDGTYSFSEHSSGTCSHHEGVAQWLPQ